jgi:hypothetical protein
MQSLGQVSIRTVGASGGWHFILGNLTEAVFPLDVYRCPSCKRVEFFDFDERMPAE